MDFGWKHRRAMFLEEEKLSLRVRRLKDEKGLSL